MHRLDESISIVVPAFNRAASIGDALSSLQQQTHRSWQALVVDDGSTDDTCAIVKEYGKQDPRIILLEHDRRKGAQAARNTGIRAATSKWVAFLDSDDRYLPDSLERRLQKATETQCQVVHSACAFLDSGAAATVAKFQIAPAEGDAHKAVLLHPGPMFQALLVTKDALTRIGLLDETIQSFQEWDTAIRLAAQFQFGFVHEPTFLYRLGGLDSISRDALRSARGYHQVVRKHFRAILFKAGPRAMANHYSTLASLYWTAGRTARALSFAARSVMLWPPKIRSAVHAAHGARRA